MVRARILVPISLVVAVAAGGVAGAVMGVPALSGASETTTTTPSKTAPGPRLGRFGARAGNPELAAAAQVLGLTVQQLRGDLSDGKTTIADVAKQRGVDVQKVVDAMTNADRQRIEKIVNSPWPQPPAPGFGGLGGPNGSTRVGPRVGFGLGGPQALDAASKALGITRQQLLNDLRGGQTIAQIAKSKNVDVNYVIDAMVKKIDARVDHAQSNGTISAAQATAAKTKIKNAIMHMVENGFPQGLPFGGGLGRAGKFGGSFENPNSA
jgi:hypothetical protein